MKAKSLLFFIVKRIQHVITDTIHLFLKNVRINRMSAEVLMDYLDHFNSFVIHSTIILQLHDNCNLEKNEFLEKLPLNFPPL